MTRYPHERQIEYWVSRAIEEYFENEGYDIVVLPNSPRIESKIPYDHLFAGRGVKVFGFQYKRLHYGKPDYWTIDVQQFQQVSRFGWIYYALPQITTTRQHRNALHLLMIVNPPSLSDKILPRASGVYRLQSSELGIGLGKTQYYRWGGFVQKLFDCTVGWQPETAYDLVAVFSEARELLESLVDLYVVPITTKLVIRISPFVKDLDTGEQDFDFGVDQRG